jgi:hypothetical protein
MCQAWRGFMVAARGPVTLSMNASVPAPGSSGARPASAIRNSRSAFSSWATFPQV